MRGAVFLDRDGVITKDIGHLASIEQLCLLHGVAAAIKRINDHGIPVIVVTNQSVVGRGLCSKEEMIQIHTALNKLLAEGGANINEFYYCPHHPTAGVGNYRVYCQCRKPNAGLLYQASRELNLDLEISTMVGDKITDLQAGWQAGCRTVLVSTGFGSETRKRLTEISTQPDHIAEDLDAAVDWILNFNMTI